MMTVELTGKGRGCVSRNLAGRQYPPISKVDSDVFERDRLPVDGEAVESDQFRVAQPVLQPELGAAIGILEAADRVKPLEQGAGDHKSVPTLFQNRIVGECDG